MLEAEILPQAFSTIISWYRENRRALPWRTNRSPYGIWLSEIMLQQTRVETVKPYYERFLRELPTIEALAAVPDDRLMKLWEGLGYYSRARNLKKAAICLCKDFGSKLPAEYDRLRSLPGIGPYTAGAIASIAFGLPEPAVDGNVLRITTRLLADASDITLDKTKKKFTGLLREAYPSGEAAADLTQGLMELGQTHCLPNGAPLCKSCPLRGLCLAHQRDETDCYPVRSPKKDRKVEEKTVFLLHCGEKYALCRRPNRGLLAGLWELPNTAGHFTAGQARQYLEEIGIAVQDLAPCGDAIHIFTHVQWQMTGYSASVQEPHSAFFWKTKEQIHSDCALPSAFRFYSRQIK